VQRHPPNQHRRTHLRRWRSRLPPAILRRAAAAWACPSPSSPAHLCDKDQPVRPPLATNRRPLYGGGGAEWEEAHLSWKRRLDGYCACTAIVKEGRDRGRQAGTERETDGWWVGAAGGRSRRRQLPLRGFNSLAAGEEEPSPIPRTHFAVRTLAFKNLPLPHSLARSERNGAERGDRVARCLPASAAAAGERTARDERTGKSPLG